jgi:hypothetical protein
MNAFSPLQNLRYAEMIPDIVSWHGRLARLTEDPGMIHRSLEGLKGCCVGARD